MTATDGPRTGLHHSAQWRKETVAADADEAALIWLSGLLSSGKASPGIGALLRMLLRLGWMQRGLMLPALLAAIALSALALAPPVLLAYLIDTVFASHAAAMVIAIGAALAGIAVIDAILAFVRRMLAARTGMALRRAILNPAFAALIRLPIDRKEARDQGLLGRTFEEVERLAQGASENLLELALGLSTIFVLAVAMLMVNAQVGIVVLTIVAALAVLHVAIARRLRAREASWFDARSHYWTHLVETIAYAGTVRANSAHHFVEQRFADRLDQDLTSHLAVTKLSAALDAVGRLAGGLITAAIAMLGGAQVIGGHMSIGDFVLFLSVGGSLAVPVLGLVKSFDDFQAMIVSMSRLSNLIQGPHERISRASQHALSKPAHLTVSGLSFRYRKDAAAVLDNESFTITPGEKIAVLGRSGIGKSTLASLLFGARHADHGDIMLDGVPIARIPLNELRRRIVIVPHDIDIFTGTVSQNIALGFSSASLSDITRAARIASIDADILALPQGYDTLLGQGGIDLSAGQKQRLGIARAVLRKPDILILDESTASLDQVTEAKVIDGLMQQCAATTIIAITHRPSVTTRMQRAITLAPDVAPR